MRYSEPQPAVYRRATNPPPATAGRHRALPDRQARAHTLPPHNSGPVLNDAEPASSDLSRDAAPDFAAIKQRQQAAWSAGNDAVIGTTLQIVGENLCEALDVRAGQRVLDLAAGNGNATLAAARRWCEVTATDYVPQLLERARERARADGVVVAFREADVEALPFPDASFDVVVSTFGAMFAPNQARAAAEMVRVCAPGGRIGLANWTPDGFIGQVFRVLGEHVRPAPGFLAPTLWGTRARIDELFGDYASGVAITGRAFAFRYRSPKHWIDVFRRHHGPVLKAFAVLDDAAQAALTGDLLALIGRFNRSGDQTMVVQSSYLETIIDRR